MTDPTEGLLPDTFRITPRASDLTALGRAAARSLTRDGRRRESLRWTELGLLPARRVVRQVASAATDELFLNVVRLMNAKAAGREIGRVVEETHAAVDVYRRNGWLDNPLQLHGKPAPLDAELSHFTFGGRDWQRLDARQPWTPPPDSPGSGRWLAYPGGQRAVVNLRRHAEPRPWLVIVHGAYMGELRIDTRIFDVAGLHYRLGFNIAMPVLPLHGERQPKSGLSRSLPSLDTMDNVYGLTQAVFEVRSLLAWIREQEPASKVGLYGVSLGGYVASLAAGLEPALDCLIAGVPAVDFAAVFHSQTPAEIRSAPWYSAFHDAVVELQRPISPLAVTPETPRDRRFLYAARGDRVLPPRAQALRLWEHWGRPESFWFDGAHVVQVRNKAVRRFVEKAAVATLGPTVASPGQGRTSTDEDAG